MGRDRPRQLQTFISPPCTKAFRNNSSNLHKVHLIKVKRGGGGVPPVIQKKLKLDTVVCRLWANTGQGRRRLNARAALRAAGHKDTSCSLEHLSGCRPRSHRSHLVAPKERPATRMAPMRQEINIGCGSLGVDGGPTQHPLIDLQEPSSSLDSASRVPVVCYPLLSPPPPTHPPTPSWQGGEVV
jgi:hypothetical protein